MLGFQAKLMPDVDKMTVEIKVTRKWLFYCAGYLRFLADVAFEWMLCKSVTIGPMKSDA